MGETLPPNLLLDAGSRRLRIARPGCGLLYDEPSLLLIHPESGDPVAAGSAAASLFRDDPHRYRAVWPIRRGEIASPRYALHLLREAIRQVTGPLTRRPALLCAAHAPSSPLVQLTWQHLSEELRVRSFRRVLATAAALCHSGGGGTGGGRAVLLLGYAQSDFAVFSGELPWSQARIPWGGLSLDEAVARRLALLGVQVGLGTCEAARLACQGRPMPEALPLRGRDRETGTPRVVHVPGGVLGAIWGEEWRRLGALVARHLDRLPAELAGDLWDRGLLLAGGPLRSAPCPLPWDGILTLPCHFLPTPEHAVAEGLIGIASRLREKSRDPVVCWPA